MLVFTNSMTIDEFKTIKLFKLQSKIQSKCQVDLIRNDWFDICQPKSLSLLQNIVIVFIFSSLYTLLLPNYIINNSNFKYIQICNFQMTMECIECSVVVSYIEKNNIY